MCAICNVSLRRHVLFNFSVPDFVFLHDLSKYSWGHSLCTHRLCMNSPNFQPLHAEKHRDNKYTNEKYSRWINAWINECTTKGWLCSCPTRFKCIFKSFFFSSLKVTLRMCRWKDSEIIVRRIFKLNQRPHHHHLHKSIRRRCRQWLHSVCLCVAVL